jgi:hypothetical protein
VGCEYSLFVHIGAYIGTYERGHYVQGRGNRQMGYGHNIKFYQNCSVDQSGLHFDDTQQDVIPSVIHNRFWKGARHAGKLHICYLDHLEKTKGDPLGKSSWRIWDSSVNREQSGFINLVWNYGLAPNHDMAFKKQNIPYLLVVSSSAPTKLNPTGNPKHMVFTGSDIHTFFVFMEDIASHQKSLSVKKTTATPFDDAVAYSLKVISQKNITNVNRKFLQKNTTYSCNQDYESHNSLKSIILHQIS